MAWIELKYHAPMQDADALSSMLTAVGAIAVTLEDAGNQPLYEPDPGTTPLWTEVMLTGLFEHTCNIVAITITLELAFPQLTPHIHYLEETDWQRVWMHDFPSMQFGQRVWIVPSYNEQEHHAHQVLLDPGLAFGTGKHPTTALCLQWLDQHIHHGEHLIDYGCGSGILGITALKLGAQQVYAIDHDAQALTATQENAQRNGLTHGELIALYPEQLQSMQVDILIANILAGPLIALAEKFNTLLRPKGRVVLSGILSEQIQDVIPAYQPFFEVIKIEQLEGWVRIDAYKLPCNYSAS